MPVIEPIPLDALAEEPRRIIEEGVADGTYATPVPLQIFAYRTEILLTMHQQRMSRGQRVAARWPDPGADPDPERPAGRVPAVHAVAQA